MPKDNLPDCDAELRTFRPDWRECEESPTDDMPSPPDGAWEDDDDDTALDAYEHNEAEAERADYENGREDGRPTGGR